MCRAPRYDDYISFMKDKYRKEVLTPLRRQTEIVESFIGSQNWEEINYNRTWTVVLCERWHPMAHLLHDDLPNLERGVICYIMLNYQRLPSFSIVIVIDTRAGELNLSPNT